MPIASVKMMLLPNAASAYCASGGSMSMTPACASPAMVASNSSARRGMLYQEKVFWSRV